MRQKLLLLLTLIMLIVPTPSTAQSPFTPEDIEQFSRCVVQLIYQPPSGNAQQGSGVVVSSDGVIFTAAHVVENNENAEVRISIIENSILVFRYIGVVEFVSDDLDFAIVRIAGDENSNSINSSQLNFDCMTPNLGPLMMTQPIYILGYPTISSGLQSTYGQVSGSNNQTPLLYQTDAAFLDGVSGGFVVNENGEYIGIPIYFTSGGGNPGQLATIIPLSTIYEAEVEAHPYLATATDIIFFTSNRDGEQSIYTMNPDGRDISRIGNLPSNSAGPDWSPVTDLIVFHADYRIYTVRLDGSELQQLTDSGLDEWATWSPNGRQIAFHSWRDGDMEIFVMNRDGSNIRQVTSNRVDDGFPEWSPDGERIVFQRDVVSGERGNSDIFVINVDGTGEQRLTNNRRWDWVPNWSPDGQQIAFMAFDGSDWEIFAVDANGRNERQLTNNNVDDFDPDWSTDSRQIAFTTGKWNSNDDEGNEIALIDTDGTNIRVLTDDNYVDGNPRW